MKWKPQKEQFVREKAEWCGDLVPWVGEERYVRGPWGEKVGEVEGGVGGGGNL